MNVELYLSEGTWKLTHASVMKTGGTYLIFNKAGVSAKYFGQNVPWNPAVLSLVGNKYDLTGCFVHTSPIPELDENKQIKADEQGRVYHECKIVETTDKFAGAMEKPIVDHIGSWIKNLK